MEFTTSIPPGTEIFRIDAKYNDLNPVKKLEMLRLLEKWTQDEINRLQEQE